MKLKRLTIVSATLTLFLYGCSIRAQMFLYNETNSSVKAQLFYLLSNSSESYSIGEAIILPRAEERVSSNISLLDSTKYLLITKDQQALCYYFSDGFPQPTWTGIILKQRIYSFRLELDNKLYFISDNNGLFYLEGQPCKDKYL